MRMRYSIKPWILIFFCLAAPGFTQYHPPDGGENVYELISPLYLGAGVNSAAAEPPQSGILNPALSALVQRAVWDFSYLTLIDFTGGEGWGGHIVNIGNTVPNRAGVFTWGGHFFTSALTDIDIGTFGSINVSFSKRLYPSLLIGAGLNIVAGQNDQSSWGLDLDLGFLHILDATTFRDLKWGVVLRDFGKGFNANADNSSYPSPFTLAAGIAFSPIKTEDLILDVLADISFPSFQNIRLNLGLGLDMLDRLDVHISSQFDLRELISDEIARGSFVPAIGLGIKFNADILKFPENDIKARAAFSPLIGGTGGIGVGATLTVGQPDQRAPAISIDYPSVAVLSFNGNRNDSLQTSVDFGIEITDERYLHGYEFIISNETRDVVYEVRNEFTLPRSAGFQGVLNRLSHLEGGLVLPERLNWDGRVAGGEYVADGGYSFYVAAWDDNGNKSMSPNYAILVDSTPPTVDIIKPTDLDLIFSPNSDGNKDTIRIEQSGSHEDRWIGQITKDGEKVRSFSWNDAAPKTFIWDGVSDDGTLAGDGIYLYSVAGTDLAGNSTVDTLKGIVISTQATPITLAIERAFISPNDDGRLDSLDIQIDIPIRAGIESWELSILDEEAKLQRAYRGGPDVPALITFDGRDQNGSHLAEGSYGAQVQVVYLNGNQPWSESPPFTVDITPPDASVASDLSLFSPNGDGNKDLITFFQETTVEERWVGEIVTESGVSIVQFEWIETADAKFAWDGHAHGGLIASDGLYLYRLYAEDLAGNRGGSRSLEFRLSTEAASVLVSRGFDAFSPNADGSKDFQSFLPQVTKKEGIDRFTLRVFNKNGDLVRSFAGRQNLADRYFWEGLAENGTRATDGSYYGQLEILYTNGNRPIATTRPFLIDTEFPEVTSKPERMLFSPNGDGKKDTVTFNNSSSVEALWEAHIVNSGGSSVRRLFWKDTVSSYVWDGSDDAGNRARDGIYYFEISTTDEAGNFKKARSTAVTLDTRITNIFVSTDAERFSPNGDGKFEEIAFTTLVNIRKGVSFWQLDVKNRNGATVRRFDGTRIPEKIIWDGTDNSGIVEEGEYFAEFQVVYEMGNEPRAATDPFIIDTSGPELDLQLNPMPFSPDADGHEDLLAVAFKITDGSDIKSWGIAILDPKRQLFKEYQGDGMPPATMIWGGFSESLELVLSGEDYPYEIWIQDVLGNTTVARGSIPIDILLFRRATDLSITITNLAFEPNSSILVSEDGTASLKNIWVLDRIARILRDYADYRVKIEAHTVSLNWNDPVLARDEYQKELLPLTEARAETVKNQLISRGIDPERISTEGIGGEKPIVPHGDIENRWKNRRVEIILMK
ncbi:MAG: flagellar motor protein MotB [Spirochaetales bacterium]|nr:flagellar motor protein MotB [Spirochaetales bacterium]